MIRHFYYAITAFVIINLLADGCAQQGTPDGGPKDTIPPVLLSSVPKNQTLNFKGNELYFEFDERINADKIKQQLVITPITDVDYKHLVKKNLLIIKLEGELEDSTTYTFNFSDAVVDVTEKNPAVNLKLAISTGPYIDSLFIKGKVTQLKNGAPVEEALVALYPINDTISIFTDKPKYFTRTDAAGNYSLENLKDAKYLIYTWLDENRSLTLQADVEAFGFEADTINLLESIDSINIPLQLIDIRPLELVLAKTTGSYFDIRYSKYIDHYDLILLDSTQQLLKHNLIKNNEYLRFYNLRPISYSDSTGMIIDAYDSLGNSIIDTVFVKFNPSKKKPDPLVSILGPTKKIYTLSDFNLTVDFSKPITSFNMDSISIAIDTFFTLPIQLTNTLWNYNRTSIELKGKLNWETINDSIVGYNKYLDLLAQEADTVDVIDSLEVSNTQDSLSLNRQPAKSKIKLRQNTVTVQLNKGTFVSIENDTTERLFTSIDNLNPEDYGTIIMNVKTDQPSFIVELISTPNKNSVEVIASTSSLGVTTFRNVPPGKYFIRIIQDTNGDKKWSYGNYYERLEPELTLFPNISTDIKANWEVNLDVEF